MTTYEKKKERAVLKALGVRQWLYFESIRFMSPKRNRPYVSIRRVDTLTGDHEVLHHPLPPGSSEVWVPSEWRFAKDFVNSTYRK